MNVKLINNLKYFEHLAPCKIGFLGGSFNPIHKGHMDLIEYALDVFFDYVVFCPHLENLDNKEILAPIEHRVKMISATIGASRYNDKIFVADNNFISGTHYKKFIDFCHELNSLGIYTGIICGSDSLLRPYYPDLLQFDHFIGARKKDINKEFIKSVVKGKAIFFDTSYNAIHQPM